MQGFLLAVVEETERIIVIYIFIYYISKKEIVYTGKALKLHEKIVKLEADLKTAKDELKVAYKEQLKAEKVAEAKARKEAAVAAKKALKEKQKELMLRFRNQVSLLMKLLRC